MGGNNAPFSINNISSSHLRFTTFLNQGFIIDDQFTCELRVGYSPAINISFSDKVGNAEEFPILIHFQYKFYQSKDWIINLGAEGGSIFSASHTKDSKSEWVAEYGFSGEFLYLIEKKLGFGIRTELLLNRGAVGQITFNWRYYY
ncbi:MAG: hypothetical protein F9K45_05335 [Melioribacteraceae bacterium]|nr:MAG: hypothetical protein F9K45_05335 [Melioribacteraceae bacterium]